MFVHFLESQVTPEVPAHLASRRTQKGLCSHRGQQSSPLRWPSPRNSR